MLVTALAAPSPRPPVVIRRPQAIASAELAAVKRIFVDDFGPDPASRQVQATVVTALVRSGRFIVTENRDRADAILRGTAIEASSQEVHAFSEGTAVGRAATKDTTVDTQTDQQATVSLRLVSKD